MALPEIFSVNEYLDMTPQQQRETRARVHDFLRDSRLRVNSIMIRLQAEMADIDTLSAFVGDNDVRPDFVTDVEKGQTGLQAAVQGRRRIRDTIANRVNAVSGISGATAVS